MNILFGCYYTLEDASSAGIYEELRQAGHRVTVEPRLQVRAEARRAGAEDETDYVTEQLARRVERQDIDVVLARSLAAWFRSIDSLVAFREAHPGVKLVELSHYHPYQIWEAQASDMSVLEKTELFDLVLTPCHNSVSFLRERHGVEAIYYPVFATPLFCDIPWEVHNPRLSCDVMFPFGGRYQTPQHPVQVSQLELVYAFLDAGITNIRIYGGDPSPDHNHWIQADESLAPFVRPNADLRALMRQMHEAKLVCSASPIGPNSLVSPSGYWLDSLPSASLAKSCVLSDNPASVTTPWTVGGEERQLIDGEHIVTYKTVDEAVERAQELLGDEERRAGIQRAGYEYAAAHLTEDEVVPGLILPAIERLFE